MSTTEQSDETFLQDIGIKPSTTTNVPTGIVDLDHDASAPATPAPDPEPRRRYTPWVLGVFLTVTAVAVVATTLGTAFGHDDPAPPHRHVAVTPVPAAPAPMPAAAAVADTDDHPLPFTATADCPPGSTTAQSIADPENPTPWICVRRTEGQPLHITLGPGIERAYVITAVTIVPGDTGTAREPGADAWLEHRVVTKLQWQFNDTGHTVVDQDTGNARGEVSKRLETPITASRITVIIRATSPPTRSADPTTTSSSDGLFDLPAPDATTEADPSDGTFAVSSIKIIGHKAT